MRVRYGNFRFSVAASEISISNEPILNALSLPVAVEVVWLIRSRIRNPSGDSRKFAQILRDFEQSFVFHGLDLVLEHTDGTPTYHVLKSRDCIGGTRVTKFPTYPTGVKGQGINYRDVEVGITGTVPLSASQYLSFSEKITIRGGGAKWGCREVNYGPGVRQQLRTNTTCFATQSGSAVGFLIQPDMPLPIWPGALVDELPDYTLTGPRTLGASDPRQIEKGIDWNYQYESPFRLLGLPHFLLG